MRSSVKITIFWNSEVCERERYGYVVRVKLSVKMDDNKASGRKGRVGKS